MLTCYPWFPATNAFRSDISNLRRFLAVYKKLESFSNFGPERQYFVTPTKKVVFCPLTEGFENKRSRGGTPRESVFQPEVKGRKHDLLSGSYEIIFSFFTHEIEVFYPQTHLCAGRKKTHSCAGRKQVSSYPLKKHAGGIDFVSEIYSTV